MLFQNNNTIRFLRNNQQTISSPTLQLGYNINLLPCFILDDEMHPNILKQIRCMMPLTHRQPPDAVGRSLFICGLFWQSLGELSLLNEWWGQMIRVLNWTAVLSNGLEMDPISLVSTQDLPRPFFFNKEKVDKTSVKIRKSHSCKVQTV